MKIRIQCCVLWIPNQVWDAIRVTMKITLGALGVFVVKQTIRLEVFYS